MRRDRRRVSPLRRLRPNEGDRRDDRHPTVRTCELPARGTRCGERGFVRPSRAPVGWRGITSDAFDDQALPGPGMRWTSARASLNRRAHDGSRWYARTPMNAATQARVDAFATKPVRESRQHSRTGFSSTKLSRLPPADPHQGGAVSVRPWRTPRRRPACSIGFDAGYPPSVDGALSAERRGRGA